MTLSETQKLSTGPTFPVFRISSPTPRDELFSHVVRLDDSSKNCSPRFGPGWWRRLGRPRHSLIQQIGYGTPFSIRASCRMVQGSSLWPLWVDTTELCCLRDLMMMMTTATLIQPPHDSLQLPFDAWKLHSGRITLQL